MNLDELQAKWAEQDAKISESLRLNHRLIEEARLRGTRSATQRLSWELAIETAANAILPLMTGSFLYDHLSDWRFATPALMLHLLALAILGSSIVQLVQVRTIDLSGPILAIQQAVERLRLLRTRTTFLILAGCPLMWGPMFIVSFKGLFNVDVYRAFGTAYVTSNFVFGAVVLAIALWTAKGLGGRVDASPKVKAVMDALAGKTLREASLYLKGLSEFEAEAI